LSKERAALAPRRSRLAQAVPSLKLEENQPRAQYFVRVPRVVTITQAGRGVVAKASPGF
jgi:hypothetical protein